MSFQSLIKMNVLRNAALSILVYLIMSSNSYAAWSSITFNATDIKKFTMHTTNHSVASAHNYAVLNTVSILPLTCNGLHINTDTNKSSYALLVSALTSGQNLKIGIDSSVGAPWDSSICAINYISLIP